MRSGYGERTLYRRWTYLVLFAVVVVVVGGTVTADRIQRMWE